MAETPEDWRNYVFDLSQLEANGDSTTDKAGKLEVIINDVPLNSAWMNSFFIKSTATEPLIVENPDELSDTESQAGGSSAVPSPMAVDNNKFSFLTDRELVDLSVKDLNSLVKTLPKDEVKTIKKRRRTLKNRGYAHSCRIKRLQEKSSLESSKQGLEKDNEVLRRKLETAIKERDLFKKKYETLVLRLTQYRK